MPCSNDDDFMPDELAHIGTDVLVWDIWKLYNYDKILYMLDTWWCPWCFFSSVIPVISVIFWEEVLEIETNWSETRRGEVRWGQQSIEKWKEKEQTNDVKSWKIDVLRGGGGLQSQLPATSVFIIPWEKHVLSYNLLINDWRFWDACSSSLFSSFFEDWTRLSVAVVVLYPTVCNLFRKRTYLKSFKKLRFLEIL